MIAANEIEAQAVSLCHFKSSHLIEESGASVALADSSLVSLAEPLSFELAPRVMALGEDSK
jgi:hypothetical protein